MSWEADLAGDMADAGREDPEGAKEGVGVEDIRPRRLFERSARVPVRHADEYLSALEDVSAALDVYVGSSALPEEVVAILDVVDEMLNEAPLRSESHGI